MSKRTAYFSNGEIIEQIGGKSAFKRNVKIRMKYADEPLKVWFRPCDAWRDATQKSLDAWARNRGFASYEGYQFLRSVLAK